VTPIVTCRLAVRAALWAAAGVACGLLLAATLPLAFGDRSFTVMSGSMEPAISAGDVVVTQPIHPREARVGDVVTFRDPEGSGHMITHRVRDVDERAAGVAFTTKGDANNKTEHWTVARNGEIGRVAYRLPVLGYAFVWTRSPLGRILLIAFPLIALGAGALMRIWRPSPDGALTA
jgi:signal peptidase